MEFDLDIALEFVEKVNPEPTPIEYITGQTGDVMLPVILAAIMLLLVSFGAFMFFKKRKARINEASSATAAATKAAPLMSSKWIALAVVATLITAVALFAGSIVQAQASGEGKIETPSTVKAYVDKEAGTVSFDTSWIKNISSGDIIFDKSKVVQVEESLEICDLSNSNFKVNALGGTVFNGHPNDETPYIPTDLTALPPEETSDMTFDLTNVSATDLFNLIGHKVFNIKLWYLDSAIPVPQPNKLTYNGAVQTGVNEGIGYTLSGTTETKDAGTYTATARLISGFVWEDGSRDDKTITWKIDKLAMTITSGDAEKTYDGEKAAKEEVTEDPAFPEGEGFVYTWTSNVVNVEDTADANNTFTFDAQAGTNLNNYDATPIYGKLTITPRAITLQSGTDSWTYDATSHSCKEVSVTEGSWVGTDGVECENFASVIDHSDQPTENTFEYEAKEGTLLSNYTITQNYGEIHINKITTPIAVKANSNEKTYDATPLTDNGFIYTQGILQGNDQLYATITGKIINFGTADNIVGEVKIMRGPKDATVNYTFGDHTNGTLTINKREISISSVGVSLEYNAQEQSNPQVEVVSGEWVTGEGLDYSNFATAIDYNGDGVDNTFEYTAKAGTNLSNYSLDVKYEKLQITKVATPITVTAKGANKTYDGDALTSDEYTYTQNILKGSDALTATTSGSVTNVGTATNTITDIVVKRGQAVATQNYNFQRAEGTLEVTQRNIVFLSSSGEWTYDGQSHNAPTADVAEGTSWAKSEGVEYSGFPSVTNYNDEGVDNIFEYTAKSGTNLNNYKVTKKYGKLIVKQVSTAIVVTANSKTREYDGTALTDAGYTYTQGILVSGDQLTATVEAESTVKNAGDTAANKVTSVKVMRGTQEVTDNYTFGTHIDGTLEVTKRNVVLQSEGYTWTYNSMQHGNQVAKVKDGYSFASGEGVSYSNFASVIDYTEEPVDNSFDYAPYEGTNLNNYDISYEFGKLIINKITTPLIVTANSNTKTYDGTALTDGRFTYTANVLQGSDFVTATNVVQKDGQAFTLKDVGQADNVVTDVKVMRGDVDASKNYTFGTHEKGTLTVTKRNITVTSESKSFTYDGDAHKWEKASITSGSLVDGEEITFNNFPSVSTVAQGKVNNTFSIVAKEGTKLENYEINYMYGLIEIATIDTPIIVTAASDEKTYDGAELTNSGFTYTENVLAEGDTLTATITGSIIDAGTAVNEVSDVKVTNSQGADVTLNYNWGSHVNGALKISKRNITLISKTETWDYDAQEHTSEGVTVKEGTSWADDEGATYSNYTKIIDHQNLPIDNKFDINALDGTNLDNYNLSFEYGKLQINKVETPIVVKPASSSKVYDGTALTADSYTITQGQLVDGDELNVVISGTITDVGETTNSVESYKVMRGDKDATINYNLAIPETGTLTVTQRPITLTSGSESWDYDGEIHTKNSVAVSGDGWADGEGATYSNFPTVKDVKDGEKENIFDIIPTENTKLTNYNINIVKGKISIKKVTDPLIVTANSKSKTYDGTALTDADFTYTNVLKGSDQVVATISGSQTDAGESANVVVEGSVKVQRDGVDISDNYSFGTHVNGTLTVNKRAITLTSGNYEGTYDGQEHSATAITVGGEGLASGQVLACTNFAKIKNYTEGGVENTFTFALEGGISANNYNVTYEYGLLKVNKKAVMLTSGSASREYNGLALTKETVTADGFIDGEGATYSNFTSVIDVCTDTPNEFTYELKDGTLADNYTITSTYGKLTITKVATAIVVTANSDQKTYDGNPLTNSGYTKTGSTKGSDQLVVVIEGTITNAGTVTNTVTSVKVTRQDGDTTKDVSSNYNLGPHVNGTLTVYKAKPTVSWEGVSDEGYKLDRNDIYSDPYNFEFTEKGISLSSTNTDSDVELTVVGSDLPSGVSVSENSKIVIDPTIAEGTTFNLTVKATSTETTNYLPSDATSANINIAISSLYWGIDEAGTLYISPFESAEATTESEATLSAASTDDIAWYSSISSINKVIVQETSNGLKVKPVSLYSWFSGATNITSIDIDDLDASQVTSMNSTFSGCTALSSLDLSGLNTVALTDMASTFANTTSLATLTLGGDFTTESVTTMNSLFKGTNESVVGSTVTTIVDMNDSFETSNVTDFDQAFALHRFTSLDLSGFDTSGTNANVAFRGMFRGIELTNTNELDVSSFNVNSTATNMQQMFAAMNGIDTIKFGEGFVTSQVNNMTFMFQNFQGTILDLSSFSNNSISSSTGFTGVFAGCTNLTTIYVDPALWQEKEMSGPRVFQNCSKLFGVNIDGLLTPWNSEAITGAYARIPFEDESGVIQIGLFTDKGAPTIPTGYYKIDSTTSTLHLSPTGGEGYTEDRGIIIGFPDALSVPWINAGFENVVVDTGENGEKLAPHSMAYWFTEVTSVQSIDLDNIDASNVTSMYNTFLGCDSLTSLDLSHMDTSNLRDMHWTFGNTDSLETLTLGGDFTTEKVTTMEFLFQGTSSTVESSKSTEIIGMNDSFKTSKVTTFNSAFSYHKFKSLDFTGFDTSGINKNTSMYKMFEGAILTDSNELDVSTFSTNLTTIDISMMFSKLGGVKNIKFGPDFVTEQVSAMTYMFSGFEGTQLDLSNFSNNSLLSAGVGSMFKECSNLTTICVDPTKWRDDIDLSRSGGTFAGCVNLVGSNADGSITTSHGTGSDYDAATYARVPSADKPGLLTDMNAPAPSYWIDPEGTGTLHLSATKASENYVIEPKIITGFASVSEVPWLTDEAKATYTQVIIDSSESNAKLAPESMEYWFQGASNIVSINLNNLDASKVTSMKSTFSGCSNLSSLDLSNLHTICLTDMSSTFANTNSLKTLKLGGSFTTENVTTMQNLFKGNDDETTKSSTATEIIGMEDSFNATNIKTLQQAFSYHKFTSLNLNGINTPNIENRGFLGTFLGVQFESDTELDVSSLSTNSYVTQLNTMFADMINVSSIKFGEGFTANKVANFGGMFRNYEGTVLDLRYFNNSSVTSVENMFSGCTNLTTIYVDSDKWIDKSVTSSTNTFKDCFNLVGTNSYITQTTAHGTGDTYNLGTYARVPSEGKPGLLTDKDAGLKAYYWIDSANKTLHLSPTKISEDYILEPKIIGGFSTYLKVPWLKSAVKNTYTHAVVDSGVGNEILAPLSMKSWFRGPIDIESIDLSNLDSSNVTSLMEFASLNTKLNTIIFGENFNTQNVETMKNMFNGCTALNNIDLSKFNTSKVTDMGTMFKGCTALDEIDVSKFDTSACTTINGMFSGCSKLEEIDVSKFVTNKCVSFNAMFDGCSNLLSVDVSNFDTKFVTNLSKMFNGCSKLTTIDLSSFDTSKVERFNNMFSGCSSLNTIYVLDKFVLYSLSEGYDANMFASCSNNLKGGAGTIWSADNPTDKTYAHIDEGPSNPGYFSAKTSLLSKNNDKCNDALSINKKEQTNNTEQNILNDPELNPVEDSENIIEDTVLDVPQAQEDDPTASAEAALMGAPILVGALFFRKRIRGKHAKIK